MDASIHNSHIDQFIYYLNFAFESKSARVKYIERKLQRRGDCSVRLINDINISETVKCVCCRMRRWEPNDYCAHFTLYPSNESKHNILAFLTIFFPYLFVRNSTTRWLGRECATVFGRQKIYNSFKKSTNGFDKKCKTHFVRGSYGTYKWSHIEWRPGLAYASTIQNENGVWNMWVE